MRHPPAPAAPLVSLHGQATLSMPREAPLGTCECCPRCPPSRPPAWAAKTRSRRVRRPSVEIREVGSEEGGRPLVTLGLGCGVGGTGTSDAVIYSFAASLAPSLPPSLSRPFPSPPPPLSLSQSRCRSPPLSSPPSRPRPPPSPPLPPSLRLQAVLGHAMLSIPATKGFEIGSGFRGTRQRGSAHNDMFKILARRAACL